MSFIDLGKHLLEAARLGQIETVQMLLLNGAQFTTDWVRFDLMYSLCVHVCVCGDCFCVLWKLLNKVDYVVVSCHSYHIDMTSLYMVAVAVIMDLNEHEAQSQLTGMFYVLNWLIADSITSYFVCVLLAGEQCAALCCTEWSFRDVSSTHSCWCQTRCTYQS